jgi:hypothetical protein
MQDDGVQAPSIDGGARDFHDDPPSKKLAVLHVSPNDRLGQIVPAGRPCDLDELNRRAPRRGRIVDFQTVQFGTVGVISVL